MKTLLLALLFSFSSISWASSFKEYYPLDAPENTALFVSIATGDFEKAETLLKAGANPNKKSVKGATVFTALALNDDEQGSIDFLPTLIKYGADINNQDDKGYTGLVIAIVEDKFNLLYSLLQSDADIHRKSNVGFNILHMIATFCDSSDFKTRGLLKSLDFIFSTVDQAFIDTVNDKNITPLHVAVKSYNLEFVRILDEKFNLNNIPDVHRQTPVLLALLRLNNTIFDLATNPQDINADKINKIETISEISYILLNSLKPRDLTIKNTRNESADTVLNHIEQNLIYIKNRQNQIPEFSSLYNASKPIRDYLSQS